MRMVEKAKRGPVEPLTREAFATLWATFDLAAQPELPLSGTIRPKEEGASGVTGLDPTRRFDAALLHLPLIDEVMQLERGACIGRGGMGEVFVATQRTLGREVAVKVPLMTHDAGRRARHLLREAWAMGALEHPNVVPVHQLGLDASGAPQIVMKKIAGTSLHDRLHGSPVEGGGDAALRANLDALMEVARALEFAHSRGIVHRDIKPENVMVGDYGEVYLLDWGIAVGTREEHRDRLRMAEDVVHPEGTPSYMAPEMVHRAIGPIDERTDVYLLGGTLHEILTGRPPHVGATLMAVISSVVLDEGGREYPETAPPELVAIAERALSHSPENRFPSASAFRRAIADAVRHHASHSLAEESTRRLDQLESLIADGVHDDVASQAARDHFAVGLFGCDQALGTWRDNPLALSTRRRLVIAMARLELDRGHIDGAEGMLARLDDAPPELVERVREGRAREERAQAELATRRHDGDLTVAATTRARVSWVLAFTTTTYLLVVRLFGDTHPTLRTGVVAVAGTTTLLIGGAILALVSRNMKGAILGNQVNRQILFSTTALLATIAFARLHDTLQGESYEVLATRTMLLWSMAAAIIGASVDRRFFIAGSLALTAWVGCVLWPPQALFIGAAGYFFSFASLALVWGRDARRATERAASGLGGPHSAR